MSFFKKLSILGVIVLWLGVLGGFLFFRSQAVSQPNNTDNLLIVEESSTPEIPNLDQSNPENQGPVFGSVFAIGSIHVDHEIAPENNAATENKSNPSSVPIRLPSDESVPTNNKRGTPNTLDFPSLNIKAPILFARLEDLFVKRADGTIDTSKQIQEAPNDTTHLSTPVQRLLTQGIVHLGFTPYPGQFGNSYIVGHSSNYINVKSDYNSIFRNLKNAKNGDIFTIYNKAGEGMDFKVFQNIVVNQNDLTTAYSDFKDRRVVTLQASVLVNGQPLKRLLVRGELVQ